MLKDNSVFTPYLVSAVAKKTPQNSSIKFDMLLPFKIPPGEAIDNEDWFNFFLNTFVVLNPNSNVQRVESQMQKFYMQDSKEGRKLVTEKYGDVVGSINHCKFPCDKGCHCESC